MKSYQYPQEYFSVKTFHVETIIPTNFESEIDFKLSQTKNLMTLVSYTTLINYCFYKTIMIIKP